MHEPSGRAESAQVRDDDLENEAAAGLEVVGDVAEAGDLLVLRREVHDRVADEIGEGESPIDLRRREVADRHADPVGAGLRAKPRDHRLGDVDSVHRNAASGERKRDSAGANPELERRSVAGDLGEEVHGRVQGLGVEQVGSGLVVPLRDPLVESILRHTSTVRRSPSGPRPATPGSGGVVRWMKVE